jgi:hypothetical protein
MQYLISQEKKILQILPKFFFFFIYLTKQQAIWKKKTSYAKARSNLCTLNDAITEKQSLNLLFLSSLKIPAKFSQENTRGQT